MTLSAKSKDGSKEAPGKSIKVDTDEFYDAPTDSKLTIGGVSRY